MIYVNVLFLLIFASLCFAFAFCFFRRTDKKGPEISGELMSGKAVRMILVAKHWRNMVLTGSAQGFLRISMHGVTDR